MKIRFFSGWVEWGWLAHQIILTPTIWVKNRKHYFGYPVFVIGIGWLAWGFGIEIKIHEPKIEGAKE